ncbi:Large ribosomal subunit protein uL30-like protein [Drosera capensis]
MKLKPYINKTIDPPSFHHQQLRGGSHPTGSVKPSTKKDMNAFKAFKAQAPIAWSSNLHITLVRGMPGTRKVHRRILELLRLRKCNRTVMRSNTPTIRGMLQQVKRLVVIETEEMHNARKENEAKHRALRPPLVIGHSSTSPKTVAAEGWKLDSGTSRLGWHIKKFGISLHFQQSVMLCDVALVRPLDSYI